MPESSSPLLHPSPVGDSVQPGNAQPPWYNQAADEVLRYLGSTTTGLSSQEAAQRLAANGPNEIREGKPISRWRILAGQFKSLLVWILIGAGAISALLGQTVDALAILAIVILNAAIGTFQEFHSENALAALKRATAPLAKVRRDGTIRQIPASEIVAGDILSLEAGDVVPADARLLEASSLRCIESELTGESDAVTKQWAALETRDVALADRANMVSMGTSVASGSGRAVVVATGMNTDLGRIAGLLEEAAIAQPTPLQSNLNALGRLLVWTTLGIVALLFGLGVLRGTNPLELVMTSVSLAVAAVPEGLPAVVTVALALGVLRMSRRGTLVRRLLAVETLGATSVICTDKTGTLTLGEMTVRTLFVDGQAFDVTGEGYSPEGDVLLAGRAPDEAARGCLLELATILIGCNNAQSAQENGIWTAVGDPTEAALLAAGAKAGGDRERVHREMPIEAEFPFDSERKRSTVIRRRPAATLRALTNGAPGALLQRCTRIHTGDGVRPLLEPDRHHITSQVSLLARKAYRGGIKRRLPGGQNETAGDFTAGARH